MDKKCKDMLTDILNVINDDIDCGFRYCDGPTLRPVNMATCARCALVARLAKTLGVYVAPKDRENQLDCVRR